MDEKNLENEMQEQPMQESPVQEQPVEELQTGGIEPPVQEPQTEKLVRAEYPMQSDQPVQPDQSMQPDQPMQSAPPVQPMQPEWGGQMGQEPQAFQAAYNTYGDMMPATPVYQSQAPDPKKKKGLKIALISAACVAVIAIIGLVIFFATRKTPEEVVKLAVTNAVNEIQDDDYNFFEKVFGTSEYNKDDIDMEMTFSIDEVMDNVGLNGSKVSLEASAQKNDAGSVDFDVLSQLTIADETLRTNLYGSQEKLYLEMPEILKSVILLDMNDMDPSTFAFIETEEDKEITEKYDSYMIPAREALQEAIVYEKVDKVKITNHNNDNVSTTEYTMTIPISAVKDYIQAESDYLLYCIDQYLSDEEIQDALGISREEFKQVVSQLPNYFGVFFARDFVFNFYIHGDQLARAEFQYKISMLDVAIDVSADFMGDAYVLSDVYATCDVTVYNQVVSLVGEYKQNGDSKEVDTDASFRVIYEDAEVFNCGYTESYNVSSGAYSKTISISDAAEITNVTLAVQGRIYDVEKGKSFRADFDSITLSYQGEDVIKCSAEFVVGNLGKDIVKPDDSNLITIDEIMEMDAYTLDEVIDMDKLEEIMDAWDSIF